MVRVRVECMRGSEACVIERVRCECVRRDRESCGVSE